MQPRALPARRTSSLATLALVASLLLAGCAGLADPASEARPPPRDGAAQADAPVAPRDPEALAPPEELEQPATGDLQVTVDASVGPHGDEPATIDRRFYGMNVADWQPQDYEPEPHPEFLAYLRALEPGVLRWPAGHTSQGLLWQGDPKAEGKDGGEVLSAEEVDAFLRLAREVGAQPLLAVNVKTGTPEGAADLVRHVNVEHGWGVTWWQVGNEPDHRDGLTDGPEEYAEDYLRYAEAMRAVDPSIRLVGAEVMTGAHVLGSNGAKDWMTPILERAGRGMDAVSWHYYPLDSNQESPRSSARPSLENLYQETAKDWKPAGLSFADVIFPELREVRDAHAPGAELWVTEIAEDSANGGYEGLVGTHGAALWTADVLGRFAAHGPDALVKFVFKSGSDHCFTLLDEEYQPRPAYYAYWLYARHFGDEVVRAQSERVEEVAAHAALRDDGALSLVLVNKAAREREVALDVDGHAWSRAERFLLAGDGYAATEVTVNGARLTPQNALGEGAPSGEAIDLGPTVRLPPASVTLLVLYP